MNKITFDRMIRIHPEKFAYVQPQDPEMAVAPETGKSCQFSVAYNIMSSH